MEKRPLLEAADRDEQLLQLLLPGSSPAIRRVRSEVLDFAKNYTARGALILGPVGSGKSTIARVIALMRLFAYSTTEARKRILQSLQFDGPFRIDKKSLSWYEEINLTGLIPSLAQSQLFGMADNAATGVDGRLGLFEQAMYGHASQEKTPLSAQITGGVILLDEIGDLPADLQPLLLLVLTGAEVFRAGGEGNSDYAYSYRGAVLAATWKEPESSVRPDLLSRLNVYRITVPGLNERKEEMAIIVGHLVEDIKHHHLLSLDRLLRLPTSDVSRAKLESEKSVDRINIAPSDIEAFCNQDWNRRGDLRGLRQLLERSFYDGASIKDLLTRTSPTGVGNSERGSGIPLQRLINLLCENSAGNTLTGAMKVTEQSIRTGVRDLVRADRSVLQRLAKQFGLQEGAVKQQLADLARDRRGTGDRAMPNESSPTD